MADFAPVAISSDVAVTLPKIFAEGTHFKLSDDRTHVVEWNLNRTIPTDEEAAALLLAAKQRAIAVDAAHLMARSDTIALQCFKFGVAFPAAWQDFTRAITAWLADPDLPRPVEPATPIGL